MLNKIEIRHYVSRAGTDAFDEWLGNLRDARTQARVATRIDRLEAGNFGDCKSLPGGLYGLPRLLRDGWETVRAATLWRRQAKAECG